MICPDCGEPSLTNTSRYCAHCGHSLTGSGTVLRIGLAIRVAAPTISLIASFLPWVVVGVVTRVRRWDAYHIGGYSWLWLALDLAALAIAVAGAWIRVPRWLAVAWTLFGATSLGVGISGLVFVQVSARVSTILSAPNPLSLAYGLVVFDAACALWCASAWLPWEPPSRRSVVRRTRLQGIQR